MAQHFLTFAQLKDEAEHAIAGVPNARTSSARIVNGAVEYLVNIHPWQWREAITTLAFTAGEGQILLPEDFGELVALVGYQARMTPIRKAPARQVMLARVHGIPGAGGMLFFLGMASPDDSESVPRRCIEVAPTPAETLADALYLTYRRLLPALDQDNDVPAIPFGMFELLRVLVRAMAVSTEDQQAGHDWELFRSMLPNYIHADSVAGGDEQGPMRDILCDVDPYPIAPHNEIRFPGDD